ncbi:voltage-dependent calcium channel gamma-6 subunit isoform X1 [Bos taurus]|uniref:voltage-dependent calcium channel gamma-6 subunit isoform X1 n=1 Tax=Bos taurus TaxID=9913 RepID=UPI000572C682|nr:voltage-dependent calcium channel gamma-6 subunit isoform X1 [Bos taurus]
MMMWSNFFLQEENRRRGAAARRRARGQPKAQMTPEREGKIKLALLLTSVGATLAVLAVGTEFWVELNTYRDNGSAVCDAAHLGLWKMCTKRLWQADVPAGRDTCGPAELPGEANCTYFKFFTTGENAHIFQRTTKKGWAQAPKSWEVSPLGRGDSSGPSVQCPCLRGESGSCSDSSARLGSYGPGVPLYHHGAQQRCRVPAPGWSRLLWPLRPAGPRQPRGLPAFRESLDAEGQPRAPRGPGPDLRVLLVPGLWRGGRPDPDAGRWLLSAARPASWTLESPLSQVGPEGPLAPPSPSRRAFSQQLPNAPPPSPPSPLHLSPRAPERLCSLNSGAHAVCTNLPLPLVNTFFLCKYVFLFSLWLDLGCLGVGRGEDFFANEGPQGRLLGT